jgi:hypothetical protein
MGRGGWSQGRPIVGQRDDAVAVSDLCAGKEPTVMGSVQRRGVNATVCWRGVSPVHDGRGKLWLQRSTTRRAKLTRLGLLSGGFDRRQFRDSVRRRSWTIFRELAIRPNCSGVVWARTPPAVSEHPSPRRPMQPPSRSKCRNLQRSGSPRSVRHSAVLGSGGYFVIVRNEERLTPSFVWVMHLFSFGPK